MTIRIAPTPCNLCGCDVDPEQALVWIKDSYRIVRCPSCELLFRANLPSSEDLVALYGEDYFRARPAAPKGEGYTDYLVEEPRHRQNARRRLELVGRFVGSGPLLDVGCAAGFFLDEARVAGWQATGVEIAPAMARIARERLALTVVANSFDQAELPSGAFDCVTMWDYLEHSLDPLGDLRRAHDLLRPRGVLALSTGDAGSVLARLSGRRWHLLTPRHHNFFFTRKTLTRALDSSGLRVRDMRTIGARYSLHYLAHKLRTMSGLMILGHLSQALDGSRIGGLALSVNLFDILTVVAERRN